MRGREEKYRVVVHPEVEDSFSKFGVDGNLILFVFHRKNIRD
jgi:hypothetical protein